MSIKLPDFIVPAGDSAEFLIEDKYVRGGLHTVPTFSDLGGMDSTTLKLGMLSVTQDNNKIFQLTGLDTPDPSDPFTKVGTWTEFKGGGGGIGTRQTVTQFIQSIPAGGTNEFVLPLGKTVLVFSLAVDTSCQVEAFSTINRDEPNPYLFVATVDHLEDDGSTLMTDGTVLRGRRYTFLVNLENAGDPTTDINIYFRVTNTDIVEKGVNLNISFLPIESI